ncbi:MAG TPA: DUF1326 domain-containing protein [Candidatus Binataceae bacterium]|nr:DUF1326 domain-containing protein [Candidatus Binataceae bacterium]
MSGEKWQIEGEYFESCNCIVLCPCLLSHLAATPTDGHCDVVLAVHINRGRYGELDLSGLNSVQALSTPGPMGKGNGVLAVYVDSRGSAAQRDALQKIFTGGAGGPPSLFGPLISKQLPTKAATIDFTIDGNQRKLSMPGIADITIEGLAGADQKVVWLENVFHPFSSHLAVAQGKESHYQDGSLDFRNSGRNGHFSPIKWSAE